MIHSCIDFCSYFVICLLITWNLQKHINICLTRLIIISYICALKCLQKQMILYNVCKRKRNILKVNVYVVSRYLISVSYSKIIKELLVVNIHLIISCQLVYFKTITIIKEKGTTRWSHILFTQRSGTLDPTYF